MNTAELVAKIADAHGVSKAQAKSIVDDIFKDIVDAAASGAEVSLPGFGKFKVKATPEREGRNPANGEKIKIAASKKLTFSSAKSVKDLLNGRAETALANLANSHRRIRGQNRRGWAVGLSIKAWSKRR
jgi:DNA-binding protein HU-beta